MFQGSASSTPTTESKTATHKRVPSGVTKLRPVGSDAWQSNIGQNTVDPSVRRWMQFYGLLLKRFHHSRRNIKSLLNHILLPGIFVSIAMTVALSQPKVDTYPPLVLSPTMFHPTPYNIPYSNSRHGSGNISDLMLETFRLPSGVGADCVLRSANNTITDNSVENLRDNLNVLFDKFCQEQVGVVTENRKRLIPITLYKKHVHKKNGEPTCRCDKHSWQYQCHPDAEGDPDKYKVVTLDTMVRLKKHQNIEEYLLYTSNKYRRMRYDILIFKNLL